MRLFNFYTFFLIFAPTFQVSFAQSFSFKTAFDLAVQNSLALQQTEQQIASVRLSSQILESEQKPIFTLQSLWNTRWQEEKELENKATFGAELRRNLYDFGRDAAKEKVISFEEKRAHLLYEEAKERLFWQVARSYLAVIASKRIEQTTSEQVIISSDKVKTLTYNYRQGLRPEHDKVAAQVELGKVQLTHLKARDEVYIAQKNLNTLIWGQQKTGQADIPPKALALLSPAEALAKVKEWQEQTSALQMRIQSEQQALEANRDLIKADNYPLLSGLLNYQYTGEPSHLKGQSDAQIRLSWDVPWRGKSRFELERLAVRNKELELLSLQDQQNRRLQKDLALQKIEDAVDLWNSFNKQLSLYEQQLKLAKQRYESGKASPLELSNAEADLINLRLEMIKLVNNCASAVLEVAESSGVRDLTGVLF